MYDNENETPRRCLSVAPAGPLQRVSIKGSIPFTAS